jgi:hypothetical protein
MELAREESGKDEGGIGDHSHVKIFKEVAGKVCSPGVPAGPKGLLRGMEDGSFI